MKRFLFIVAFINFLVYQTIAQQLGFSLSDDAKRVSIPFELYNNLIVVPVILNNQLPLKFIIDTGVRTAILTEKNYSDIIGLTYSRKYVISGIGKENNVEAYITNDVSLTLPGVRGKGHAMLVLDQDYLELNNYLGTNVHGILGYELFSRFIVKIDYDNKLMTLMKPEYFHKKRKYKTIPITVEDTKPYINGMVSYEEGKATPVKLMLDTGASHGLLLDQTTDPEIFVPEKNVKSTLGRGLGGVFEGRISRLNLLKIGDFCWENLLATFPESNTFLDSLKYGDVFRNGSLGGEILGRMKIIFNFPKEEIYVKKGKQFKEEFTYNLSGIVVKAKGVHLDVFEIADIRENSPGAEAGFEVGDRILSINHTDAKQMHLNNVLNYLNAKENKKLRIEVKRGVTRITKVFRLKSQI